jgi:hypothetical protein
MTSIKLPTRFKQHRPAAAVVKTSHPGAPEGYVELRRYLPERRQRRYMLGVAENTIQAWDERRASRVIRRHQERVELVLWTCTNLRPHLPSDPDVGEFLVTKQFLFEGRQPGGVVRVHGKRGAVAVVELVQKTAQRATADRRKLELEALLDNETLWSAMSDGLSDAALARLDAYTEAVEELRASRGSGDMLR